MSASLQLILFLVATSQAIEVSDVCKEINLALDFLLQNSETANLDVYAAIVWTEGHLQYVLNEEKDKNVQTAVAKLKDKATAILNATKDQVINIDPRFKDFIETVLVPSNWIHQLDFAGKKLEEYKHAQKVPTVRNKFIQYLDTSNISEALSDPCFLELSDKTRNEADLEDCKISPSCRHMMMSDTYLDPMYGVTTRVIYLQIAKIKNCEMGKGFYGKQMRVYCSYILFEAKRNMELGFIPSLDDLLLQQMAFCGYGGFSEFFSDDFVHHVFAMPRKDGCFQHELFPPKAKPSGSGENSSKQLEELTGEKPQKTYECDMRTTSMGTTALAVILRNVLYKKSLGN